MRRTIAAALVVLLFAPSALAFRQHPKAVSIAVVASDVHYDADGRAVQNAVADELVSQLRERGFDAFEVEEAFPGDADFVVEIVGGDPSSTEYGSVGFNRDGGFALGLFVARVAADIRVHDGQTLEVLSSDRLVRRSRTIVPTGVAARTTPLFTVIALPLIERVKLRRVARAAARDAAPGLIATINGR